MKRTLLAALSLSLLAACRGQSSEDPPIHIIPDMDYQQKFLPESQNAFFSDQRAMRPLVDGTIARGELREDDGYFRGRAGDAWLGKAPVVPDEAMLRRGEERFGIFCAPCHDKAGSGKGLVVQRGFHMPPDLAADHARGLADGELFDIVSNGVRNMPSYKAQIPVDDRWAIVTWVRVLQRSQHASASDVPASNRNKIEREGATP